MTISTLDIDRKLAARTAPIPTALKKKIDGPIADELKKLTLKPKAKPAAKKATKVKAAEPTKGRTAYVDPDFPGLRKNDRQRYGAGAKYLAVKCERCGAKAGKPCTEKAGMRAPHAARIAAVDTKK